MSQFHNLGTFICIVGGCPGGSEIKASAHNAGDLGLILGSGRSPGEGNGNPFWYSCLENSKERGYSPRGLKDLDMTERLTLMLLYNV